MTRDQDFVDVTDASVEAASVAEVDDVANNRLKTKEAAGLVGAVEEEVLHPVSRQSFHLRLQPGML